jgi:signal peptidase II
MSQSPSAQTPRRSPRALAIMLVSLAVYTAADLWSKEWALDHLSQERSGEKPALCVPSPQGHTPFQRLPLPAQPFIDGVLNLHYAENCGAAFSMLRTAPALVRTLVFGVANSAALIALFFMFVRGHGGPAFGAAVPLIASGAIGNVSDRLRHGFVVDFFQVDPHLFEYPVFNVADIAIAVGVGLWLLDSLKKPRAASDDLGSARVAGT